MCVSAHMLPVSLPVDKKVHKFKCMAIKSK